MLLLPVIQVYSFLMQGWTEQQVKIIATNGIKCMGVPVGAGAKSGATQSAPRSDAHSAKSNVHT
jgi:hypothetical protein